MTDYKSTPQENIYHQQDPSICMICLILIMLIVWKACSYSAAKQSINLQTVLCRDMWNMMINAEDMALRSLE